MPTWPENSVVIVGSGPSGLMCAWELAQFGIHVLVLEAGGPSPARGETAQNEAEIVAPAQHASMALAARRGFGGTSALWGGRAVPLDPIDLSHRDWVAHSGWPITWETLSAWYPKACAFLDCGPAAFDVSQGSLDVKLERWCAQPNIGAIKAAEIIKHPRIRVETSCMATRIHFDTAAGRAVALDITRGGTEQRIPVRAVIVAAGGVETARLLLNSRADRPALFGGEGGALGRYYMGHFYGSIADIVFDAPGGDAHFDYLRADSGHYFRKRLSLPDDVQASERLLNMAAWPEAPAIADARHRSAVLSMGYLALASPIVGPMLAPPAIRARKLDGGDGRLAPHVSNVLRGPVDAARFAIGFGLARYAAKIRKPGFFPLNTARRYSFFHHGEHAPNPDSRVTLATSRDSAGMLRARIDLRFSEQDSASIVRGVEACGARMKTLGFARLEHSYPEAERQAAAMAQASDGFHQIGTARMSTDPRFGVVDANARAHGVCPLVVAGSSIFPTSGQANPTLTAVALAARLAEHLRDTFQSLPPVSGV
jgi:choline dehydrogenase-like flavoprotein